MGKYYCDYCDIYLTHDSMSARKAHNSGRNHISNVRDYFANIGREGPQSVNNDIVNLQDGSGRAMFAAPSMRFGAGFMNPIASAPGGFNNAPFATPPPFAARPPFPPPAGGAGAGGPPPFAGPPPFPAGVPPFQPQGGAPPQGFQSGQPPQPPQGNPGIHPDRMSWVGK